MIALNRTQFSYGTRYQRSGFGKDDIVGLTGVVRRVQEQEMKESGKVGDVTFTFWFIPTTKPGLVMRVCAMGILAEEAEKLKENDVLNLSCNIIPSNKGGYWYKATQITFVKGDSRPAEA